MGPGDVGPKEVTRGLVEVIWGSQGSTFRFPRRSLLACKSLGGPGKVTQNA